MGMKNLQNARILYDTCPKKFFPNFEGNMLLLLLLLTVRCTAIFVIKS